MFKLNQQTQNLSLNGDKDLFIAPIDLYTISCIMQVLSLHRRPPFLIGIHLPKWVTQGIYIVKNTGTRETRRSGESIEWMSANEELK